jgi:hypothetical protein
LYKEQWEGETDRHTDRHKLTWPRVRGRRQGNRMLSEMAFEEREQDISIY